MSTPQAPVVRVPFEPFESFAWDNALAIEVADVFRLLCLIFGVMLASLYARLIISTAGRHSASATPGFQARAASMVLLAATSCMFQFDRLNDPVTILLPLNLVGLWLGVVGLYRFPFREPLDTEWLRKDSP